MRQGHIFDSLPKAVVAFFVSVFFPLFFGRESPFCIHLLYQRCERASTRHTPCTNCTVAQSRWKICNRIVYTTRKKKLHNAWQSTINIMDACCNVVLYVLRECYRHCKTGVRPNKPVCAPCVHSSAPFPHRFALCTLMCVSAMRCALHFLARFSAI